jgi:ACS family glucarate transporter-like MFS transporter
MDDSGTQDPSHRPTRIRYKIVALAMLVAVLLYLDRVCMSIASKSVADDLNISSQHLDWLLGAFFWTYALGQLPAGWLGDRFGARWMLGSYIVLWSLCTGLMGFAGSAGILLVLRLGCGLFEAGAYPVAASIVRRWVPKERRGIASSIIALGGRLGGAVAPPLTMWLMLRWTFGSEVPADAVAAVTSWRPVMILYGLVGIGIAIVFMWLFRDYPEKHPKVNAEEVALIRRGDPPVVLGQTSHTAPPILEMIQSLPLWLCCVVQFAANLGWAFLVTKMPQYLEQVHHSSQKAQGWLQSLPLFAGIAGLLLGGLFTDRLTSAFGLRWGRSVALCLSRLIVAGAFVGCLFVDTPLDATLCLAIVGLATDLGTPASWAYGQDVGGRYVGSVVGWFNMWGNFGAALSPVVLGWIVAQFTETATGWHAAFAACAALNIMAAAAAMGVNASHPLRSDSIACK